MQLKRKPVHSLEWICVGENFGERGFSSQIVKDIEHLKEAANSNKGTKELQQLR